MSDSTNLSGSQLGDLHSQLFANIVMQQAGMTMIFLGVTPHPETGETMFDLEAAKHFISQLEMLEAKTRGNLDADETALLKQSLTTVRMAFVQAVERGAPKGVSKPPAATPDSTATPAPEPAASPAVETAGETGSKPAGEEERKKFVKKY
jgi:hypothetical protein